MIDTTDIRQRLSQNTAIDAKEIQALCDEVEESRKDLQRLACDIDYLGCADEELMYPELYRKYK